jgi:hypothetical protein
MTPTRVPLPAGPDGKPIAIKSIDVGSCHAAYLTESGQVYVSRPHFVLGGGKKKKKKKKKKNGHHGH